MVSLKLTAEQRAIILDARQGGPMAIKAFAGSGKTLTLSAIAHAGKEPGLYLVYNAAMRREASGRFPDHMHPMTGHALAYRGVIAKSLDYEAKFRAARDGRQIAPSRITEVTDCLALRPLTRHQAASLILDTVRRFQHSAEQVLDVRHVPIDTIPAKVRAQSSEASLRYLTEAACHEAQKLWREMANERNDFPILHDTYLKLFQLQAPQIGAPRWLCDEYQDANPVIDAIVRQQQDCQKIYVGDPHQAIYGWRSAVDALSEYDRNPEVSSHRLSQSFRFGPELAGLANRLLRAVGESHPIRGAGQPLTAPSASQPTAVIARNNMTLLESALSASERGQRFCLQGSAGEMASMVRSAYALFGGRTEDIRHAELKGYETWEEFKDIVRLLDDQVLGRLVAVIEKYKAHSLSLADRLLAQKDTQESEAEVILITAHKAKGREWPQIQLAGDLALDKKLMHKLEAGIPLSDTDREAVNLLYVALTRAQSSVMLPREIKENLLALRTIPTATATATVTTMNAMTEAMTSDDTGVSSEAKLR